MRACPRTLSQRAQAVVLTITCQQRLSSQQHFQESVSPQHGYSRQSIHINSIWPVQIDPQSIQSGLRRPSIQSGIRRQSIRSGLAGLIELIMDQSGSVASRPEQRNSYNLSQ